MLCEKYTTVNIRDYFQNEGGEIGEEALVKVLSNFSCPLNQNVEKFLKEQAIEFTKKNQSVTYLVFSKVDATLAGYFSLASKPIEVKSGIFSKSLQKKISRVSEYNSEHQIFHLSAYLIAQFGKNFKENTNKIISGQELMELAKCKIRELQYMLGGMVTFLEAEANEKLLDFYTKQNDFKIFDTRMANSMNDGRLVQMLATL
ncbi:MAG: GNAT family acetyltransferase [Tyzzerella sp.]|nr:GNAT family acetyltransferase [Tyzzerella sp.]